MTLGVDYPWTHPAPAALQAASVQFAMRYLSTDPSKNLTRSEADALAAHGVWSGVVWETTAGRALAGQAAGVSDARAALGQAQSCGMPDGRPIYFAVDTDTTWSSVQPYFAGVASVLGAGRTGVYGGLHVVQGAAGSGLVSWFWQASAWSGGVWDSRAHIRQLGSISIGGVDCDKNTAQTADFGQWMPGINPTQEDIVTPEDINAFATAVWDHQIANAQTGKLMSASTPLTWLDANMGAQGARIAALEATVGVLAKAVGDASPGVDTATLVAAVDAAIAAAAVHVDVQVGQKAGA